MGIGSKFIGWLKDSWETAITAPPETPRAHHRAGFGDLYKTLTGNNISAAYEPDDKPTLRK
jgi:hypothetical protein